jgi:DNA-directed RNA polymerase subunit alpha
MNPYTQRIIDRIEKQTAKGIRKYGSNMQDNPLNLSVSEVVEYALEECADLMVYLENVKERLSESRNGSPKTDARLKIRMEELDFSLRPYNCLKRAGINTVEDLLSKTREDLRNVRNLGPRSIVEIEHVLSKYNLKLRRRGERCE